MSNFTSKDSPASRMLAPSVFWRIAEDIPQPLSRILSVLSIAFPFLLWLIISNAGVVDKLFLPTPAQVFQALVELWTKEELAKDILFSLFRVGSGFLLAATISIPLGTLMGTFPSIRAMFEPLIGLVRYMPASAFIPLLILYFGIGELPKVLLIFIGTLFFNTLMVMDSVKFVPKELIETTYTLGGKRLQVLLQVISPFILPNIIDAARVNMAASWNLVIVSELVAATEGLGRKITVAQRFLKTDQIFAGVIVIGLIGLSIDLLFRLLQRTVCKWSMK